MQAGDHFVKFTERARKVLSRANEEAVRLNQSHIGTGHILLGLLRESQGGAAAVLKGLDVDMDVARQAVETALRQGDEATPGEIGLTAHAKKAIELTADESRRLNYGHVGTEHLLLGLLRESEGIAAGVLTSLGIDQERARAQTIQVMGLGSTAHAAVQESTSTAAQPRWIGRPLHFAYQPYHITGEAPDKTPIGKRALGQGGATTLLGWVTVNTGGAFILTLYQGMAADAPKIGVISNPATGAYFPFHCLMEDGLAYTLTGTPGSVTILYADIPTASETPPV
ncbi:MAG TPA: Clp protease N-terminal domain-containing protein [Ktedonobacterales bacterium]|nr:Clp protease N-terminal domain-containing protein [Ktedonobacterales bacterium]